MKKMIISSICTVIFLLLLFILYQHNTQSTEYSPDVSALETVLNATYDGYAMIQFPSTDEKIEVVLEEYTNGILKNEEHVGDFSTNELKMIAVTSFADLENQMEYITIVMDFEDHQTKQTVKREITYDAATSSRSVQGRVARYHAMEDSSIFISTFTEAFDAMQEKKEESFIVRVKPM